MSQIATQKCFNHAGREAAARCPACGRCFCRECITEHEGRVMCAACLRRSVPPRGRGGGLQALLAAALRCAAGFLTAWLVFYYVAQALLRLPSSFHEGALWREIPWERP
ncbi:MAG: rhomboid family protein [Lentisphaerae bacterium]|nr:rhomboid family protein [Lentisphaerota bacterium]